MTQSVGAQSTVTMPAVGFPKGWRLRPGDRVGLRKGMKGAASVVACPLVRPVRGVLKSNPSSSAELRIADASGLLTEHSSVRLSDGNVTYIADFIDNDHGERSLCFALRPERAPLIA
ncbi:hypothetical protein [Streptomyces sp. NPDC048565]|uniref:hypothetical protein n=1 Tax=Streptomyces sp. NPDC048565 TaxID=3155266 RepID=UPI003421BF53